jgi:lysophospholipase L1-like esterase
LQGALCAALLAACSGSTAPSDTTAGAKCEGQHWLAAWSASPQASTLLSGSGLAVQEFEADLLAHQDIFPNLALAQVFNDQSLRLIVAPHAAGASIRLRLSNRFQKSAVTLDHVYVGLSRSGTSLVPGSNQAVSFGGSGTVSLAPGAEVSSDAVALPVHPFQNLAISFHIKGLLVAVDYHLTAQQVSYLSPLPGSYGDQENGTAFGTTVSSWYVLNGIDVLAPAASGAVVSFGDSLTDGYLSSYNSNSRYPDFLARRLLADASAPPLSVVDAGISGNFVASDSYIFGPAGTSRFAADALAQPGVTDVIVYEGINDIGGAPNAAATADQIIAADKTLIAQAHAQGLNVIGATLTPAGGAKDSAAGKTGEPQALRQTVNDWIRGSGAFDAVADFDAAVRDPADPTRIAAQYDGGDHLHFNDAGYQALAAAVDLGSLRGTGCR